MKSINRNNLKLLKYLTNVNCFEHFVKTPEKEKRKQTSKASKKTKEYESLMPHNNARLFFMHYSSNQKCLSCMCAPVLWPRDPSSCRKPAWQAGQGFLWSASPGPSPRPMDPFRERPRVFGAGDRATGVQEDSSNNQLRQFNPRPRSLFMLRVDQYIDAAPYSHCAKPQAL